MKNNKLITICISTLIIGLTSSCATQKTSSMNNMVARMEVKEPINGVCDNSNVIVILPLPGNNQSKAVAPITKEELTNQLNSRVSFLKDKSDYEDKGMINMIVNCKGELVRCEIGNKTKSPELDRQIVAVFAEMKKWKAGKVNNYSVDTVLLYSFTIKNGKIILT